jgi:membrane-associated phospholipid phosphatase
MFFVRQRRRAYQCCANDPYQTVYNEKSPRRTTCAMTRADQSLTAALRTALILPPAILSAYLLAAWLTAGRGGAASLALAWERHIPLVPWMIVPYLSLDALLVTAIFLCRDRDALRELAIALALATLLCAVAFVLCPMKIGFERIAPPGAMGRACAALWAADPSYNRFPSLHVAIAVILWRAFVASAARPQVRTLVHLWFILVIVSTLLTWQHHVIDVIAGAAVGAAVSISVSRLRFSRRNSSSAPGPKSHSAAVQPNATPVHVPR